MSTNIQIAISELHKAFHLLDKSLFNGELPEPAILIQNKGNRKNVLGWCSREEIWHDNITMENKYEINIVAERLNRTMFELMGTLIHEMVHMDNKIKKINDVTRSGTYHNKKFKETAEQHGLIITYDKKIGWSYTELHENTKELITSFELNEEAFTMERIDVIDNDEKGTKKTKTSSRKYECPLCGVGIRASKEVFIICGICKVPLEKVENEEDEPKKENIEKVNEE